MTTAGMQRGPESGPLPHTSRTEEVPEPSHATVQLVAVEDLEPCPYQPRVNVKLALIGKLADSMKAGRHEPLLDVEPAPGQPERYRIVCGEQRWRAAREAGIAEVLVRIHPRLGYLERLQKQYEENRLRAELDPVEDIGCIQLAKTIRDIEHAERLLREAPVPFQPLDDKRIESREQFMEHLDALKQLLLKHRLHVIRGVAGLEVATLSPWSETERALGISASYRKAKLRILQLDPEELERVRELPAEHAIQIARLPASDQRTDLIDRAEELTHHEVRRAVDRLLQEPSLGVDQALAADHQPEPGPLSFEGRLDVIADLCRQLVRSLNNILISANPEQIERLRSLLAGLDEQLAGIRAGLDVDHK